MGGYEQDQIDELQAIQAIYPDEITVISEEPPIKFDATLTATTEDDDEEYKLKLLFQLGEKYPEVGPQIEIEDLSPCFDDFDREDLMEMLNKEVSNNLGMVMVFSLISNANEWLQQRGETLKKKRIDEQERKIKEAEAEEMRRFEGTRVTVETFMVWKRKFDAEVAELEKSEHKDEGPNRKLNGRELFEKDKSLAESDLKFLNEDDDVCLDSGEVKVDESLFQALDDIELDDSGDE